MEFSEDKYKMIIEDFRTKVQAHIRILMKTVVNFMIHMLFLYVDKRPSIIIHSNV